MTENPKGGFAFESEQLVLASPAELFEFFSKPAGLAELSPPWVRLRVLSSSTPSIREGTTLDYAIRIRGFPMRWRSLITKWSPPFEFIDEQVSGPYRSWIHRHSFVETENGVLVRDRVRYSMIGGSLVNRLFVRPELEKIFSYRQAKLRALFSEG